MEAARNDNVHTLQKLTSSGVDVTGIVGYNVSSYMCSYTIFYYFRALT